MLEVTTVEKVQFKQRVLLQDLQQLPALQVAAQEANLQVLQEVALLEALLLVLQAPAV